MNEGRDLVPKKAPSNDEALEALDFIINVLKEHEKDLDRLIGDLGTITDRLGDTGQLGGKIEKVEGKLGTLQNEITNLISYLSSSQEKVTLPTEIAAKEEAPARRSGDIRGPPVILRCKQWNDFKTLASQAQTLSFQYKESEKTFQVDALKGNQVITYNGESPEPTGLLRIWLARQLGIPDEKVLEGILAIG